MQQTLTRSMTASQVTLSRDNSKRARRQTVSVGIQTLRQVAASLRAAWLAQRVPADANTRSAGANDLLQKASILERSADVLAITNEEMIRLATIR